MWSNARRRISPRWASPTAATAVGGDFFQDVPRGGDAYLLKHVIHDWNDERAVQILTACRRAMGPDARLADHRGRVPEAD